VGHYVFLETGGYGGDLALMQLTLHDSYRAWQGFDWDTLDRLNEKGWIENPRSKAKSVVLTEEGLANSARLFQH
jgi:uncharacterized protein DUF6429